MNILRTISLCFVVVLTLGAAACKQDPKSAALTSEQKEFLANQTAYKKAKMSIDAPTFEGAELILEQVKDEDITDAALASYLALCKKVAAFSADLGIPRDSELGFTDIIKNLDYAAIFKHLTSKGMASAPSEAARLVSEALKIKNQLPVWNDLDESLAQKYE